MTRLMLSLVSLISLARKARQLRMLPDLRAHITATACWQLKLCARAPSALRTMALTHTLTAFERLALALLIVHAARPIMLCMLWASEAGPGSRHASICIQQRHSCYRQVRLASPPAWSDGSRSDGMHVASTKPCTLRRSRGCVAAQQPQDRDPAPSKHRLRADRRGARSSSNPRSGNRRMMKRPSLRICSLPVFSTTLRSATRRARAEELNGKDLRPDQLFRSALPPRKGRATRVDSIAEGLWTFTQPFPIPMVGDPDLRMTVATLGDGTLLVGRCACPERCLTMCSPQSHLPSMSSCRRRMSRGAASPTAPGAPTAKQVCAQQHLDRVLCHNLDTLTPIVPNARRPIDATSAAQLNSPVAPTGEVLKALEGIGRPVGHIVLPNGSPEHWYFGPAMAAAFPDATVWVSPGQTPP